MYSKPQRHYPYRPLKQLPVPEHPWNSISMDFIEKLPPSSGFDAICQGWCQSFSRVSPFGWFFHSFPFWFPLLFFYPFLSPLLLTNQAPMISIKGGTGTMFILGLISEDICCTRQVFVFILEYYKLRISTVPAGHYLLLAPVFEWSIIVALSAVSPSHHPCYCQSAHQAIYLHLYSWHDQCLTSHWAVCTPCFL